jgi:hypothetical protein
MSLALYPPRVRSSQVLGVTASLLESTAAFHRPRKAVCLPVRRRNKAPLVAAGQSAYPRECSCNPRGSTSIRALPTCASARPCLLPLPSPLHRIQRRRTFRTTRVSTAFAFQRSAPPDHMKPLHKLGNHSLDGALRCNRPSRKHNKAVQKALRKLKPAPFGHLDPQFAGAYATPSSRLTPRMSREQTAELFASRATEGSELDLPVRHACHPNS